ncbi:MAG: hypothetical protein LH479_05000 [Polaromonas sp.]|nr:hypothetical protein [Polaromonas sp.]
MVAIFKGASVFLLIAAYALAGHLALTWPGGQTFAAALAVGAPALAFAALVFHYLKNCRWLVALADRQALRVAVAASLASLPILLTLWLVWPTLLANAQNLYFAQHLGTNALLAWIFGRTLRPRCTPLVVTFARIVHPVLPPPIEGYARKVTLAWTLFFLITCAMSAVLFFFATLATWSAFAVLLQWPSVGLFFVGEYVLRISLFRHFDHATLKQGFEAYQQHQVPPAAATKL